MKDHRSRCELTYHLKSQPIVSSRDTNRLAAATAKLAGLLHQKVEVTVDHNLLLSQSPSAERIGEESTVLRVLHRVSNVGAVPLAPLSYTAESMNFF